MPAAWREASQGVGDLIGGCMGARRGECIRICRVNPDELVSGPLQLRCLVTNTGEIRNDGVAPYRNLIEATVPPVNGFLPLVEAVSRSAIGR